MNRLGVLGTGNMGSAIINGINNSNMDIEVFAYDKDSEKLSSLSVRTCSDEKSLVSECKYVLLAVKPQVLGDVLDELASAVTENTVFISICAGISEDFIRSHTISDAKVVLVMPNTPMMLGAGASAMAKGDNVSDEEFSFACSVIGSCGITEVVPMDKMKEIICINGSSPAFIYLFAKGFIDFASENGIDADAAMKLFSATLVGSAKMLTESGMTVDELIKQVSSPGGTTIAGLEMLYKGDIVGDVKNACSACTDRAYELSK